MADNKIKILIDTSEAAKSLKDIKSSIKDLKSAALEVGEGSSGFKQLTQQANALQDKLDDLKDSSKSLQGTGIEKLKSSFGLLTESFKNADFGKAKTAFTGLGSAMKAIPIFLIIEGIQYLVENFEKLSQGSGFLAKALQFVGSIITKVTEGITWLLDKLGLVNAELDKQAENLAKNAEKGKAAIDKQNTAYDQQIALLKSQGKSTVDLEIAKQNAIIKTNQLLVQQTIDFVRSGGQLSKAQQEILTSQLNAIKQASVDKQVVINTDHKATADANKKASEEESKKKADRDAKNLKESQDQAEYMRKQMADVNKMIAADAKQIEDDRNKESLKALEDTVNKQAEIERNADAESIKREGDRLEAHYRMINAVNVLSNSVIDAFKRMDNASGNLGAAITTNLLNAFNKISDENATLTDKITTGLSAISGILNAIDVYQKQQADQDTKERQEKLDVDLANLETAKDAELAKEGLTADQKIAINNKYAQQEYELKVLEYNKNTEVKKKAFEQDKKLKIAQTVISTITGVVAAVTGMISAVPGPVGIVLGALAGAAVAAMGVIQVAAINKQKFDAGAPPAAPSIQAPSGNADVVGAQATNGPQLYGVGGGDVNTGSNNRIPGGGNEPIRAYVVTEDITTSQNKNAVIERRSSF